MLEIAWNAKKAWNIEKKKIHKKFKQHSINIKNYTAHPHDMVHIPAKFRENTSMRFWVTVRKLNVTDGRTDGRGALQYLPSRAFGAAGDKKEMKTNRESYIMHSMQLRLRKSGHAGFCRVWQKIKNFMLGSHTLN